MEGKEVQEVSLKQPLLLPSEEQSRDDGRFCRWVGLVKQEAKVQVLIAWPMVTMGLLQYSMQMISVMFVGHLDELSLSGASIASSFANVTGFNLLMGMACALETLCGQAYGAKQYHLLGILLQRAVFILLCTGIPLSMLWMFMENILTFLGQDPIIALEAGKYARWMIPSMFAWAFLQPLVKFLQAQSIVMPMMFCSALTLAFHVPLCWLLVFKAGLGNRGAALAISISYWVNVVLLLLYITFSSACKKTWAPISKDALKDIKTFFKLAIPSAAMICLEYWSFEMLILLSGMLPNPELETSVLSICLSTASFSYMIPYGLGAAGSTRVSNELGAGRAQKARLAVQTAICMVVLEAATVAIIILAIRNIWGEAYSRDKEVIGYVSSMMPLLSMSTIMDGFQGVLSGIARGCGWQKIGAYANLAAYYIVGIPVSLLLAFVLHIGGKGLWLGIFCGLTTQTILLSIITACTDWSEQEKKARMRVNASALPVSGSDISKGLC